MVPTYYCTDLGSPSPPTVVVVYIKYKDIPDGVGGYTVTLPANSLHRL